jgi:NAD(P)-dependent dehydrogenase (short-subunit alcohol dehydrogenase family)
MTNKALDGRAIVVIGGTTGLGLSAAIACVRAGAKVVACGRSAESAVAAQAELGDAAHVFAGDATHPKTSNEAIRLAIQHFGRFDALYHVAGGSGRQAGDGPLHEITDAGIETTLQLNLFSLIYSNRAAAQALLAGGRGGSVLNMGSVLGWSPSPQFFATHVYAAAKSAIIGFTKSCAAYYAPHDIRFNVLAPGLVDTPMAQRAVGNEAIQQFVRAKQPLEGGRVGRAEDLDAAVVYFLSDESRYVTGQVLAVDGGWTVSEGRAHDE